MKKILAKLQIYIIIFLCAVLTAAGLVFLPLPWGIAAAAVSVAAGLALVYLLLMNKRALSVFKQLAPPSYFSDLRFRNMDSIAVGSTEAWKYLKLSEEKTYDATGFSRSNAMCFNMLKTYFSHTAPGGVVYYIVDPAESRKIGDYISPCDYLHIHRLVFSYLGNAAPAKRRALPMIYDFSFSRRCCRAVSAKKRGRGSATWKRSGGGKVSEKDIIALDLDSVVSFCRERELDCRLVIINRSKQPAEELMPAYRKLIKSQPEAEIIIVSDSTQLNEAVCL